MMTGRATRVAVTTQTTILSGYGEVAAQLRNNTVAAHLIIHDTSGTTSASTRVAMLHGASHTTQSTIPGIWIRVQSGCKVNLTTTALGVAADAYVYVR